jgi:hypothetical protein
MKKRRELLTLRGYARSRRERQLRGGTLRAVQKAIETGRITATGGKIDRALADEQWLANTSQTRQPVLDPQQSAGMASAEELGGDIGTLLTDLSPESETVRRLLDGIRQRAGKVLPELARRLEFAEYIVDSAGDVFDNLLFHCGGALVKTYEWPVVIPWAERASGEVGAQADEFFEKLDNTLAEIVKGAT